MSTTLWKHRRAITYAWLLRSNPGPLQDAEQANRILARHYDTVRNDLVRMGLPIEVGFTSEETNHESQEDRTPVLAK